MCLVGPTDRASTDMDTPAPVRFLPEYDNVLLSHADRTRFFDGDIFTLYPPGRLGRGHVLVDSTVQATWLLEGDAIAVRHLDLPDEVLGEVADLADQLASFLGLADRAVRFERMTRGTAGSLRAVTIAVGDQAPDFTLPGTGDRNYSLAEYRGRPIVLVFYPGDDTPVYTKQLNTYNDDIGAFRDLDAAVLAISPQGLESHERFASKYGFDFPLLADTEKAVAASYGTLGPSASPAGRCSSSTPTAWSAAPPPCHRRSHVPPHRRAGAGRQGATNPG